VIVRRWIRVDRAIVEATPSVAKRVISAVKDLGEVRTALTPTRDPRVSPRRLLNKWSCA